MPRVAASWVNSTVVKISCAGSHHGAPAGRGHSAGRDVCVLLRVYSAVETGACLLGYRGLPPPAADLRASQFAPGAVPAMGSFHLLRDHLHREYAGRDAVPAHVAAICGRLGIQPRPVQGGRGLRVRARLGGVPAYVYVAAGAPPQPARGGARRAAYSLTAATWFRKWSILARSAP